MAARIPVALLATLVLAAGGSGCVVLPVPEGVVESLPLPPDLPSVLHEGMHESEVIARLGAPARRVAEGAVTTLLYAEELQREGYRLEMLGFRVSPAARTRTQLHLVFQDDSLTRAWLEVSADGRESETRWLVGRPKAEAARVHRRLPTA